MADASAPHHLLLLVNANASGARGPRGPAAVRAHLEGLGAKVEVAVTWSLDEMQEALAAAGARRVVLLGGDGTVHAAAGRCPEGVELALIPAGRANNVAHALGIPRDPGGAAAVAVAGTARGVDLMAVDGPAGRAVAVEGLSVGFLAQARARYHARNSAHPIAAARAGLGALAAFHPLDVRVGAGGHEDVLHVAQVFVANLPLYLSGLPVAPAADPFDGMLDIVAIAASGRRAIPGMLWHLRRGTHIGRSDVLTWRVPDLRLSTGGRSPVIADSDDLGRGPVHIRVLPGALRLVVAPS